jgi:hypothetical protein
MTLTSVTPQTKQQTAASAESFRILLLASMRPLAGWTSCSAHLLADQSIQLDSAAAAL